MRKLGICVRYITDNYGSMLQLMALQKAVDRLGWDYEFIVYDKKNLVFIIKNLPRIFNPYFFQGKMLQLKKKVKLRKYPQIVLENQRRLDAFANFRKKYFHNFSETYKGFSALQKGAYKYDAVLVGSDQLWGPEGLGTNFYNLMFVPDSIRKVAYSTSFGVKEIPASLKSKYKKFIDRIEYIGVREQAGQKIVKDVSGRTVPVVVDPVMLFDKEQWEQLVPVSNEFSKVNKQYMLCYFLGSNPEHRKAAKMLQERTGWDIVTLPHIDEVVEADLSFGDIQLYDISPEQFLNLIRNAEYICTDSFHGTAFSIINQKEFTVFNRFDDKEKVSRNSRIDTICNLLNLEERRYDQEFLNSYNKKIDYIEVTQKLELIRNESWDYIERALQ